jgi:DNA (cytosine-5)-methyltransferase 1
MLDKEIYYSSAEVADMLSISKKTLLNWETSGKLSFAKSDLLKFLPNFKMFNTNWAAEMQTKPVRDYYSIELFAGAGGLALGPEKAGFKAVLLNEIDKDACQTLRDNRHDWGVRQDDITNIDFKSFAGEVDFLSGGFPCQAFSYAGKKLGFEDTRGTLFYQFARAIKEIQPKDFLGENVRGLLKHDHGRTLSSIKDKLQYHIKL